jgi:hypothetical protein
LAKLACKGGGPVFRKIGRRGTIYTIPDLDDWALSKLGKLQHSASESKEILID